MPELAWLCYADSLLMNSIKLVVDTDFYPDNYYAEKAKQRLKDAVNVLKRLQPEINADSMIALIDQGRAYDPGNQRLNACELEYLMLLLSAYLHLGYQIEL